MIKKTSQYKYNELKNAGFNFNQWHEIDGEIYYQCPFCERNDLKQGGMPKHAGYCFDLNATPEQIRIMRQFLMLKNSPVYRSKPEDTNGIILREMQRSEGRIRIRLDGLEEKILLVKEQIYLISKSQIALKDVMMAKINETK